MATEAQWWTVELTEEQFERGRSVGRTRQIFCFIHGSRPKYGADPRPLSASALSSAIHGATGECAASVGTGLPWVGQYSIGKFRSSDLAQGVEVRTGRKPDHDLLLHREDEGDKPDAPYIQVNGATDSRLFTLVGWILGRDGMKEYWWNTNLPSPAYRVPQHELRPMDTLADFLSERNKRRDRELEHPEPEDLRQRTGTELARRQ